MREAWLQLAATKGVGFRRLRPLLDRFKTAEALLQASDRQLRDAGASERLIEALRRPDRQRIEAARRWLQASSDHHLLTPEDPDYPPLLREIPDPPLLLFAVGRPEVLAREQIAIVGSRSATQEGIRTASAFARALAERFVVVSGLAYGIDAAAHRGALEGGETVAVMGTGPDRIYPAEHEALAREIRERGALLTELFPGTEPSGGLFPRRNRIIAGMALAILVVEAGERSGALITARLALEYNREVMAIPGSIHKPQARGCHRLIQEGAKLVTSLDDILEELPIPPSPQETASREELPPPLANLLAKIDFAPTPLDLIAARVGLSVQEIVPKLLELELRGYIGATPGGYQRLQ